MSILRNILSTLHNATNLNKIGTYLYNLTFDVHCTYYYTDMRLYLLGNNWAKTTADREGLLFWHSKQGQLEIIDPQKWEG